MGALLILFCATTVAVYTANAGHRRPVLVVERPVRAGGTIGPADIGEARVAADPMVHVIPAAQRDRVMGRIAVVDLVPGALLMPEDLGSGPDVAPGFSVVGLNVKLGFAPAGLRPAMRVRLVLTPAATASGSGTPQAGATGDGRVLVPEAKVFGVTPTPDGQGQIVSVMVDNPSAAPLAAEGARGEVSVILLGGS